MATAGGIDEGLDVVLRPLRRSDAARWLQLLGDAEARRYGSPSFVTVPTTESELGEKVDASVGAWADRAPGALAIGAAADPARFLGEISWRWTTGERLGIAEVGYSVHPDARGRGVARTALVLLTRWLLDPDGRGLARVQLDHSTENPASCRVALAAGLEREGMRRGYLPLRDPDGVVRRHDVCLHGTVEPPPLPR